MNVESRHVLHGKGKLRTGIGGKLDEEDFLLQWSKIRGWVLQIYFFSDVGNRLQPLAKFSDVYLYHKRPHLYLAVRTLVKIQIFLFP